MSSTTILVRSEQLNDVKCSEIPLSEKKDGKLLLWAKCCFCEKSISTKKVCGNCSIATYCSKECQSKHWPKHKEECKLYKISFEFREKLKEESRAGIPEEFKQFVYNTFQNTPIINKAKFMKFCTEKKENNVLFYSAYDKNLFIKPAYFPPEKDSTYKIVPVDMIRTCASKKYSKGKKVCIIITSVNTQFYTINLEFIGDFPKDDACMITLSKCII